VGWPNEGHFHVAHIVVASARKPFDSIICAGKMIEAALTIYGAGFLLVLGVYRGEGRTALLYGATWVLWFPIMFTVVSLIVLAEVKARW
jgi:hypothetical protein